MSPIFRHCLSPPVLSLSLPTAKSLSFGLRVKLLVFPLSIQSGLQPQELILRGLAGTSHMRPTARNFATPLLESSLPLRVQRHTGQVYQSTLASWWQACGAMVRVPARMHTCWHTHVPGTSGANFHQFVCDHVLHAPPWGSSSHSCDTVGAAGRQQHHVTCCSTCGIQESSGPWALKDLRNPLHFCNECLLLE